MPHQHSNGAQALRKSAFDMKHLQALSFGKLVCCITIGIKTHKMQSYRNVVYDTIKNSLVCFVTQV